MNQRNMLKRFLKVPTEAPKQGLFFEGAMDVNHLNPICKLLNFIGLVPPAGKQVPLSVYVSTSNVWYRSYDGYFVTTQWNSVGEKFGPYRLTFDFVEKDNIIQYVHTGTRLFEIFPIPRFLLNVEVVIDHDRDDSWHLGLVTKLFHQPILHQHGRVSVSSSKYHRRLHHTVLFDGVCVMCDKTVDFIIQRDSRRADGLPLFKMAAIQSKAGQQFIEDVKLDKNVVNSLSSVVLVTSDGQVLKESDAAIEIVKGLNFPWPVIGVIMSLFPKFIRDIVYRFIGRNRYKWFGTKEACSLPSDPSYLQPK